MTLREPPATILVADDDRIIRHNLGTLLRAEGFQVREAADGLEAGQVLSDPSLALALLDLKMPGRDGLSLLRDHAERLEDTPVIVITAYGGSAAAIEAMRLGAYDYLSKPFDLDEVQFTVRRALTQRSLVAQVQALSVDPLEAPEDDDLIGRTPAMVDVFKMIGRVASTSEPVLITGESGTGKELVAAAVHRSSPRHDRPLVRVNSAALSGSLLESELFGHEKGAFTGAVARRRGRFEQADGGTLFLDEIGEMDVALQAKLLRVLQTGQFERVGGEETLSIDVRVLAATNRDLQRSIAAGQFREDLYYRLAVVCIHLPPLRERRDDVPLLAEHLIRRLGRKYGWPHLMLAPAAVQALAARPWPGNVRELANVLTRAAIRARGAVIGPDALDAAPAGVPAPPAGSLDLRTALADTERRVIAQALEQEKWNRTQAARVLGISRRQLFDKIRLYQLQPPVGGNPPG